MAKSDTAYEMHAAVVVADKEQNDLIVRFHPKEGDETVTIRLPSGAVGHLISQVAAAHQKLALQSSDVTGTFIPLTLTGARHFDAPDMTPTLLLQFDNVFELAVLLSKSRAKILSRVVEHLHDGRGGSGSIGRH